MSDLQTPMDASKLETLLTLKLKEARESLAAADDDFAREYAAWHKTFLAWVKKTMPTLKDGAALHEAIYREHKYGGVKYYDACLERLDPPRPPKSEHEKRVRRVEKLQSRLLHLQTRKSSTRLTPDQLRIYLAGEWLERDKF